MKFRKKPVVVEAEQWDGTDEMAVAFGFRSMLGHTKYWVIDTLEGMMRPSLGDWIITGVNGEKYPCKPDIFEKTYEAVADKEPGDCSGSHFEFTNKGAGLK